MNQVTEGLDRVRRRKRDDPARDAESTLGVSEALRRYGLIVAWVIVVVGFSIASPGTYPTQANASDILGSQAVLVMVALGLVAALRIGAYDLSVAAVLTMSSVLIGLLNLPLLPAIAVSLAFGAAVGLVNSIFIVVIGMDSIVVTLGMATVLQGVAIWRTGGETLTTVSNNLTQWVIVKSIFTIPLEFYYALALTIVMWIIFQYTPGGRRALYVGRNPEVARLSGVNVTRVRILALVTSGVISALAGVVYTGTTGSASPTSGLDYLLPAFAAAYLGATSIRVGEFNAWGTIIAAYFLVSGVTGLSILGAQSYVQQIFYGAALIVAVTISTIAGRRAVRGRAKREMRDQATASLTSGGA